MTEQMPPELAALVGAERTAPVAGEPVRAAVRAKLGTTLAISAPAGKSLVALKLVTILVGVVAAGATIAIATRSETPARAAELRDMPGSARTEEPALDVRIAEAAPEEHAIRIVDEVPADRPLPPPSLPAIARSQTELLAEASRLLASDPARSLALVDEDARMHEHGALAEEREALRIRVLLSIGRDADARTAARAFRMAYPNTIHRHVIERALDERTTP